MDVESVMQGIFNDKENTNLALLLDELHTLLQYFDIKTTDSILSNIVDLEFFDEIKSIVLWNDIDIYFGKTLRDLKCVIMDNERIREHEIFVRYNGPKKLVISRMNLPHAPIQDIEYNCMKHIVIAFKRHLDSLSDYLTELENIDNNFVVTEPLKPTFKDCYRVILLDDRVRLHIEITPNGLATNIHVIGQKYEKVIKAWNHNLDAVDNIMAIKSEVMKHSSHPEMEIKQTSNKIVEAATCSICLSVEVPNVPGVPLPLCSNTKCGSYFHRYCLYQWLLASCDGRSQRFGVASGACPSCFGVVVCLEKD